MAKPILKPRLRRTFDAQLGVDFQAKTYAQQLADLNAWFEQNYGSYQLGGSSFGRVPGAMGNALIDYWAKQLMVGALSRGVQSITSSPPGDYATVGDAMTEVDDLWKPYTGDDLQSSADTVALWDSLALAAEWLDEWSKTSPQKVSLTAPASTPPTVPPPFGKRPPPGGGSSKPGAFGWLMLVAALYLATRKR